MYDLYAFIIGILECCPSEPVSLDNKLNEIGSLIPITNMGSNNHGQKAKKTRGKIKYYFTNEGELQYQYDKI